MTCWMTWWGQSRLQGKGSIKPKVPISLAETSPRLISCGNSGNSGDQKMACTLTKETSPRLLRLISPVTRETKLWLVLSRRRDVSETCWRLKKSPNFLKTCLNFPRLPGDPASLRNQRRLELPPSLQASEIGP